MKATLYRVVGEPRTPDAFGQGKFWSPDAAYVREHRDLVYTDGECQSWKLDVDVPDEQVIDDRVLGLSDGFGVALTAAEVERCRVAGVLWLYAMKRG